MTFDEWMQLVDQELMSMIGCRSDDLPDQGYWDGWDHGGGFTPHEMALEVLASEGYPC